MSNSYSSLDWVLLHWAHFTVRRFFCVYLYFVCFFILYSCCIIVSIIVSTVGWTWWDWSLILRTYLPSVLWHCWLGHLTRKKPFPIWPIMCLVGHQTLLCLSVSPWPGIRCMELHSWSHLCSFYELMLGRKWSYAEKNCANVCVVFSERCSCRLKPGCVCLCNTAVWPYSQSNPTAM